MPFPALTRRVLLGGGAALALARPASAALAAPDGRPVLTISGKIGQTNAEGTAKFDVKMLESLGTASFATSTPWYNHPVTFEGVPLMKVMQAVAAQGENIHAVALDDYAADLPIADFAAYGTLLALKIDGKYLAVADKGPCFIVYPFDKYPELHASRFYTRSVWQVARIVVL